MRRPTVQEVFAEFMSVERAFPCEMNLGDEGVAQQAGMTLRDWFAGQAVVVLEPPRVVVGEAETQIWFELWAAHAYRMADAMMKAREAKP
jgi:hypothetical protein